MRNQAAADQVFQKDMEVTLPYLCVTISRSLSTIPKTQITHAHSCSTWLLWFSLCLANTTTLHPLLVYPFGYAASNLGHIDKVVLRLMWGNGFFFPFCLMKRSRRSMIIPCRKPFWLASRMLRTTLRYANSISEHQKAKCSQLGHRACLDDKFHCCRINEILCTCIWLPNQFSVWTYLNPLSQLKFFEVHSIYPYLPQSLEEIHLAERVAITESLSSNKLPTKTSGKKKVTLSLQEFQREDTAGTCVLSIICFSVICPKPIIENVPQNRTPLQVLVEIELLSVLSM